MHTMEILNVFRVNDWATFWIKCKINSKINFINGINLRILAFILHYLRTYQWRYAQINRRYHQKLKFFDFYGQAIIVRLKKF